MAELPEAALERAVRLTKRARRAVDEAEASAYREHRDDLLARHGFRARVREEPEAEVLVCYPEGWVDESGVVHPSDIRDIDAAVEVQLSGPGEQGDWEAADAANRSVVASVSERWGDVHAANAEAFADFMSNHYARPIETASATEVREFLDEYYPRNVWPEPEQAAVVEASLQYVFEVVDEPFPLE